MNSYDFYKDFQRIVYCPNKAKKFYGDIMVINKQAEFAVALLKQYADIQQTLVRATDDLSPLEQWLMLKLYNSFIAEVNSTAYWKQEDQKEFRHLFEGLLGEKWKEFKMQSIKSQLNFLTDTERRDLFYNYCLDCGKKEDGSPCHCSQWRETEKHELG